MLHVRYSSLMTTVKELGCESKHYNSETYSRVTSILFAEQHRLNATGS
jgi:hypothetical protein